MTNLEAKRLTAERLIQAHDFTSHLLDDDDGPMVVAMGFVRDWLAASKAQPAGYVVYVREMLNDGTEECAKAFRLLPDALAYINAPAFGNLSYRLFTLGEEVPLKTETISEPQPPKTTTRFKVKET